jgi:hypothetical protein
MDETPENQRLNSLVGGRDSESDVTEDGETIEVEAASMAGRNSEWLLPTIRYWPWQLTFLVKDMLKPMLRWAKELNTSYHITDSLRWQDLLFRFGQMPHALPSPILTLQARNVVGQMRLLRAMLRAVMLPWPRGDDQTPLQIASRGALRLRRIAAECQLLLALETLHQFKPILQSEDDMGNLIRSQLSRKRRR